jgi:hypothetical protein
MVQQVQQGWGSDYDEESQTLVIRFPNGRPYTFGGVPPDIAKRFAEAESKGEFYNTFIRGRY